MALRYLAHEMLRGRALDQDGYADPRSTTPARSGPTGSSTRSPPTSASGRACVVVDFGTAITYDVVSASRRVHRRDHLARRRRSRSRRSTSAPRKLPKVELGVPRTLIGKTTVDAIRSRDRLRLRRPGRRHRRPASATSSAATAPAIATGGLAHHIVPRLHRLDRRRRRAAHAHGPASWSGAQARVTLTAPARQSAAALAAAVPRDRHALTNSWRPLASSSNRVALAPLAGIGNWFVRLQARRYGAGARSLRDGVELTRVHYRQRRARCTRAAADPTRGERGGGTGLDAARSARIPAMMRVSARRSRGGSQGLT